MKSEERHQLQQNDLADRLAALSAKVKPYIPHVAAAIVLVFVGMWIVGLISDSKQAKRGEAWKDFFGAQNAEQLDVVVDRYPNSDIVPYARLKSAQFAFQDGKTKIFTDRDEAIKKLDKAVKAFEEVVAKSEPGGLLRSQALLGIAVSKETSGAVTDAVAAYKRLADECKGSTEAAYAERQIKNLDTPEARAFYSQAQNYKPKTPSTDLPPTDWQNPSTPFQLPDAMNPKKGDAKAADKAPVPPPPKDMAPPKADAKAEPKSDAKKPEPKPAEKPATAPPKK